ncbi:PTS sugar transporter subunit IIC [Holzapfeliella sp. He02]|uniref:PTS sugar transporter subunit IIC n=1 Tax=Holzapfeliella saturejae TaxID=3082953 RepID=A0ABU8SEI0_9LACO
MKPLNFAQFKQISINILNGISIGVITTLVPGAILNNLMKLFTQYSWSQSVLLFTTIATTLLPAVSALCVGMISQFTPIQTASLALATVVGAGNIKVTSNGLAIGGTGDVINVGITILIAYLLIISLDNRLKSYTILLMPSLVLLIAGGIGHLTLTPISQITLIINSVITQFMQLQPYLMGALLGASFALIMISPISAVGIATAVGVSGIASGSAGLGIVATAFALAVYGFKVNSFGTAIALILGSPKIQLANILKKPKIILPIAINAAIMGALGPLFNIQGTPVSGGFGFIGAVGPITALEYSTSWLVVV